MTAELQTLAEAIRREHRLADKEMRSGLIHAMRAGALLIKAKEMVGYGKWLKWLEQHCEVSARTAEAYMRLAYRTQELGVDSQRVANLEGVVGLSMRGALKALADSNPKRRIPQVRLTHNRLGGLVVDPSAVGALSSAMYPSGMKQHIVYLKEQGITPTEHRQLADAHPAEREVVYDAMLLLGWMLASERSDHRRGCASRDGQPCDCTSGRIRAILDRWEALGQGLLAEAA